MANGALSWAGPGGGSKTPAEEGEEEEAASLTPEVKYFKRCEEIKRLLSDKFMNLDEGFLDDFVDHIYEELFEE